MTSGIITLSVKPRGKPIKNLPEEFEVAPEGSAAQLYQALASKSRFPDHRLRITKGIDGSYIPNSQDVTIHRTGLREQSVIYVKDLGPQVAWRTVFVVEYLGPLLIHPLVYFLRPYIYKTNGPPSELQTLCLILITAHFLKREFETLFVHRFSLATMPAFNIFKNSFHYWVLAGANLAYWIYAPNSPTARSSNPAIVYPAVVLYVISQACNLSTHITLRNLRSPDSTERGIPTGIGFNLVTCPNYLFETLSWVAIWIATWSLSAGLFILVAVGQMAPWARKKEMRYRKEFPGKYKKKRYSMIPGVF
ncbi:MAG: 3-oxo-5a-steroid 4- dehydrogenase [Trichoglossum hirsutum]|nr:MAG: 3-oxo-5a-steroid 4- dehydrogenase [Trichoglossum hirsutum]